LRTSLSRVPDMTSHVRSMVATSIGAVPRVYIRHLKTWR